jgi:PAS domain S-box-containing protein
MLALLVIALAVIAVLSVLLYRSNRASAGSGRLPDHQIRAAMQAAHAVAWDWDLRSGRDVFFGDLRTMFGMAGDTHEGRVEDFHRMVHPDDRELVGAAVAEARRTHTPYRATFRTTRADGTTRWVSASGEFQYAADGTPVRMLGMALDITERQLIEEKLKEALREGEERFRLVADTAPVMLWMSGPDKLCTYFNRSWLDFTGCSLASSLGDGWTASVHPEDRQQCLETYEGAFDKREPFEMEYRVLRRDGQYRWVLDSGVPRFTRDGTFAGYIGSCVDVTSHRIAEEALAGLSHRLIEAHETERARIARELHDDIGQRMAVLTMELDGLHQVLPPSASESRSRLRGVSNRTLDLARDIQAISHSLHSSKLDYLGIASASSGFCRELADQQHIDIAFKADAVPDDVPKDVALCLFRVLQEAVNNAVRHAAVSRVDVTLRGRGGELELEVADAGIGFDPHVAIKGHGP